MAAWNAHGKAASTPKIHLTADMLLAISVQVTWDITYFLWSVYLWCLYEVLEVWTESNFNENVSDCRLPDLLCNIVLGIEMHDVLIRDRLNSGVWQVAPDVALERINSRLGGFQKVEALCGLYLDGLGCEEISDAEDEVGALDSFL